MCNDLPIQDLDIPVQDFDTPVQGFLTRLDECFSPPDKKYFEISWVLTPGRMDTRGRMTAWIEGSKASDFDPVGRLIDVPGTPPEIKKARELHENPCRQGVGIACSGGQYSYRLYLHGRSSPYNKDHYRAWKWDEQAIAGTFDYTFHYQSGSSGTTELSQMLPAVIRPVFESLVTTDRFRQLSGYWLRKNEQGVIDQVDLAFPWCPLAGSLPGMSLLREIMSLSPPDGAALMGFPLRHISFRTGTARSPGADDPSGTDHPPGTDHPHVNLYTSVPGQGYRIKDETDLHRFVLSSAIAYNSQVEKTVFSRLPVLPQQEDKNEAGVFYDGPIEQWKPILGKKMHYHAGLFRSRRPVSSEAMEGTLEVAAGEAIDETSDAAMDEALDAAVKALYPFIPANGRLYDIGCGWGGPLSMLVQDLHCQGLGLTPSAVQYRYVASLGLDVRLGNAEYLLPPGYFDCVLMLESFCHIANKERLLAILKQFSARLVMRVNCQDHSPAGTAFGGSMHMISSGDLKNLLQTTGWRIRHWKDIREETLPSVSVWNKRLQSVPVTSDPHMETLRSWSSRVIQDPLAWGRNNPLIELVAES